MTQANVSGAQTSRSEKYQSRWSPQRKARRRAARTRAIAIQVVILGVFFGTIWIFLALVWNGLKSHGIGFQLGFLQQQAGFQLSEGLTIAHGPNGYSLVPFAASQTNLQALLAGLYNTVVVAIISIVLSTLLGIFVGASRMSKNWVVRNWAWGFIELIRNTPLLIQILFWYFAVMLQFPSLADASWFHSSLFISRQGVFIPWLESTAATSVFLQFVALATVVGIAAFVQKKRSLRVSLAVVVVVLIVLGMFVGGAPFHVDFPEASTFSVAGGAGFSPEMASLIVALTVNTGAYIAEIFRGAVGAVDKGQWEAAAALGLGASESLWVIVMPQAVRVILPSLGNQYVSLAKSTSFAIAIGFPDLFNVYGTVANQSGRSLEALLIVMGVYLVISVVISSGMNIYNQHVMRKGAR